MQNSCQADILQDHRVDAGCVSFGSQSQSGRSFIIGNQCVEGQVDAD